MRGQETESLGRPLPAGVLDALRARPLTYEEIQSLGYLAGTDLILQLRRAEAVKTVRFSRGRYEIVATPVIALTDSAASPEEPPPPAPSDEAPAMASSDPAEPDPTPPLARQGNWATIKRSRETNRPAGATDQAVSETKPVRAETKQVKKETPVASRKVRECKACHTVKPLNNKHFGTNKSCPGGFESRCNDCKEAGIYISGAGGRRAPKSKRPSGAEPTAAKHQRAISVPATRIDAIPAALHIPAQPELRAKRSVDGLITLSSGGRQLAVSDAQMDRLSAWWNSIKAQAA